MAYEELIDSLDSFADPEEGDAPLEKPGEDDDLEEGSEPEEPDSGDKTGEDEGIDFDDPDE